MSSPSMVYADEDGQILDHPGLGMAGSAAGAWEAVDERECIPMPEGSELFLLPGRLPVGYSPEGLPEALDGDPLERGKKVCAVAAFLAPAHTLTLGAAYSTLPGAPLLPLFAYGAVGYFRGGFVVTAIRVDPLPRQDPGRFPSPERIAGQARRILRNRKDNSLWNQLGTCALTNCCPAAQNLMLGRWEAPLPTSPVCNAACIGCLNHQPDGMFPHTQERITKSPTAQEVAEVAIYHLSKGRDPLVSFGQGCEGEPLMVGDLLEESIRLIRKSHPKGTINLNTNGSRPEVVKRLMAAGLSSIRVSLNSLLPERHQAYYRPKGWSLEDAVQSIREVKKAGGFASINLLCLPGVNDRAEEVEALEALITDTGLDLIQWRNLNLDPEVYIKAIGPLPSADRHGMKGLIKRLKKKFPHLRHGYFNPKLD